MLPLLMLMMMFAGSKFAPLHLYDGAWTITSPHSMAGEGKPDLLVNHCIETEAYYACEQVVNGKPMALIVFTATDNPAQFHSQPVLPDGHAAGRADLTLNGDHWTFFAASTDDAGKPIWYRTENYITGHDKIRFEQYESSDNKTWVKKNEGDEVRTPAK